MSSFPLICPLFSIQRLCIFKNSMGDDKSHIKWIPVTMARCILRFWLEEWLLIWRVAANILIKQLRKANKEWSSILVFGQGANSSTL